ncbi:MAG: CPBP family intramembrane metalloprotease [Gemmatimonadetes bacterium]|nr:CPBP family intramembrane metalloprotease [Gemmatimonadota bacterium]
MARVSLVGWGKEVAVALGWLALFAAVGVGVTIGLSEFVPGIGGRSWWLVRNGAYQAVGFFIATWVVGAVLNRQSWDRMGWHREGGLGRRIARGVALGVVMATVAVGLALVASRATVRFTPDWGRWAEAAVPVTSGLLLVALSEELALRGYPLRRLADALGPWAATVVLALTFSTLHFANPEITQLGKLNVFVAGLWLSFAFFSPGGMGYCWGLHFGWNAGLALLFDAPVSGWRLHLPAIEYRPGSHGWLDGGAFGPEGGLIGTVVFLAGTLAVLGARFRQPKEWLA